MDGKAMLSIMKFGEAHEKRNFRWPMGPTESTDCMDVAVGRSDDDDERD